MRPTRPPRRRGNRFQLLFACLATAAVGLTVFWQAAAQPATGPATTPATRPTTAPAVLTAADAAALDRMFADGLLDPTGRPFVRFKLAHRTAWGSVHDVDATGFLMDPIKADGEGAVPWAVQLSGYAVPVTAPAAPTDFAAECAGIMDRAEAAARGDPAPAGRAERSIKLPHGVEMTFDGPRPSPALAAWLRRVARDDAAAARMLRLSPATPDAAAEAVLKSRGDAWDWFADGVHAFMAGADGEALFYLRRQAEYFPKSLKDPPPPEPGQEKRVEAYTQAAAVLADLDRRRREGSFGKPAADAPKDLATWPVDRRVAYWVERLQDVNARQWGQPGGVDLASDSRVRALVAIGDPAIPALIDCIERDERLTRSVHFWRDFARHRTVMGVREAAVAAAMSILRVSVFEPASTGDNLTSRGPGGAATVAARLRDYWARYGKLPFDERMMAVLTDPKAKPEAWREAAGNLATLGAEASVGTTVFTGWLRPRDPSVPNPAIAKFKNPTVAEAILAAMDRDLAALKPDDRDRGRVELHYLEATIEVGDRAVVPALRERLKKPSGFPARRTLTAGCYKLGDPAPLTALVDEVRAGTLPLPPQGEDDGFGRSDELDAVGHLLQDAEALPAADAAVRALADERHPWYPKVVERVRGKGGFPDYYRWLWADHRLAIPILRRDLADRTPTGVTYSVTPPLRDGDEPGLSYSSKTGGGGGSGWLRDVIKDPAVRVDRAEERVCDRAADRLSNMILGVRKFHVLLKDRDERVAEMGRFLDAHAAHLRATTEAEARAVGPWWATAVLDVRPNGDAGATAADVAAGRAIFHVDGRGKPLDLKLPATGVRRVDLPPTTRPTAADVQAGRALWIYRQDGGGHPGEAETPRDAKWIVPRVLVLQAERSPDGKAHYGVVSADRTWRASEDDLAEVKPLADEKEE